MWGAEDFYRRTMFPGFLLIHDHFLCSVQRTRTKQSSPAAVSIKTKRAHHAVIGEIEQLERENENSRKNGKVQRRREGEGG